MIHTSFLKENCICSSQYQCFLGVLSQCCTLLVFTGKCKGPVGIESGEQHGC